MKSLRFTLPAIVLSAIVLLVPADAMADRPDSGFYLGAAVHTQYMEGKGTWDDIAFRINYPLSTEGGALGFNWPEKLLLGGTPALGYQLSETLSFQLSAPLNFSKASNEKYTITNGGIIYQQGVKHKITLFEGSEYHDPFGNTLFEGDSEIHTDKISALGFIIGVGFEFPTGGNNRVIYVAAQYEAATTHDTFHGTEDFHVNVGGFTAMLGIKYFPFAD